MQRLQTKKQKILAGTLAVVVLVFIVAYLSRGWLRGSVVSWTTTKLYAAQIDRIFDNDIEPINPSLRSLGIVIDNKGVADSGKAACSDGNFHFLHETVNCWRSAYIPRQDLPDKLATQWPKQSEKIKSILKDREWQVDMQTWRGDERYEKDLNKLIDPSRSIVEVVYLKKVDAIECNLDFRYDPPFETLPAAITINESCERIIHLFGD